MVKRPPIAKRFGAALRSRRQELGMSQERLAQLAGVNRSYISDLEQGGRNLSLANIEKLTRALDMSISDFFSEHGVD
ncbi:MAG: helix-turn-helix domain-containing protein [Planctomycetes bacterium]|nr:helix-turn-helix domain-containing protein [Planctomycetota bacterium]